jgi:phosphate transport system permease protein
MGVSAIGLVLLILLFLIREGTPALLEVPLSNLMGERWYPTFDIYGLLPLILGSLLVTVGAIALSLPLGVATAVFIGEIAPEWVREFLKPAIEIIAGIPSVVVGFIGIQVVSPLVREFSGAPTGLSASPRTPWTPCLSRTAMRLTL